ncbi:MAG: hypothetical protein ACOY3P_24490 [Planctomycetota bacterium]
MPRTRRRGPARRSSASELDFNLLQYLAYGQDFLNDPHLGDEEVARLWALHEKQLRADWASRGQRGMCYAERVARRVARRATR